MNSIVTSRLDFCNSSLTGITADQLNRLQRIQNCAARLIMKRRKYDHITAVIYELHWLPLEFRIQYKLAVLAFRHFEGTLPTYLSAMLCTYEPSRSLRSSTERLLKSPRVNLKSAGERSFHFAAPAVWNSLPNSLRNIHSLPQFKKQLKTHLFFFRLFWIHRCNLFVFIVCALWVLLKIVRLISTLHYYYYYY